MDTNDLIKERIKPINELSVDIPTLTSDGQTLLAMTLEMFRKEELNAFCMDTHIHEGDLELPKEEGQNNALLNGLEDRNARIIFINGDLTVLGDLLNDSYSTRCFLIVTGNLTINNWLRGDMHTFVGGDVHANGAIIGEYNDSALFVGGNLTAEYGYLHRCQPFPEFSDIEPHQIAGEIHARAHDLRTDYNEKEVRDTFVSDALVYDSGYFHPDRKKIFACVAAGKPIWKEAKKGGK